MHNNNISTLHQLHTRTQKLATRSLRNEQPTICEAFSPVNAGLCEELIVQSLRTKPTPQHTSANTYTVIQLLHVKVKKQTYKAP